MPHAEIIFEPGSKSVMNFETEDELRATLKEIQRRALLGEGGAAQDQVARADLGPEDFAIMPSIDTMKDRPAERVKKVYIYSEHPVDLHPATVSAGTLNTLVGGMAKDGQVDPTQLVSALRDEASPVYPLDQGRHNSMFKAEGTEFDLSFLNDSGDSNE